MAIQSLYKVRSLLPMHSGSSQVISSMQVHQVALKKVLQALSAAKLSSPMPEDSLEEAQGRTAYISTLLYHV
jgi:hypothetical protein